MLFGTISAYLRRRIPIFTWLPAYQRKLLRPDLTAGMVVAALAIPQALGYAAIAGVPVQVGLYAVPVALVAYAIFGSSRQLVLGPVSTVSVLSGSLVAALEPVDVSQAVLYTTAVAVAAGIVLIIAAQVRIGWIAEFLSKPIVTGFVLGLTVLVIIGELPNLTGIPVSAADVLGRIEALAVRAGRDPSADRRDRLRRAGDLDAGLQVLAESALVACDPSGRADRLGRPHAPRARRRRGRRRARGSAGSAGAADPGQQDSRCPVRRSGPRLRRAGRRPERRPALRRQGRLPGGHRSGADGRGRRLPRLRVVRRVGGGGQPLQDRGLRPHGRQDAGRRAHRRGVVVGGHRVPGARAGRAPQSGAGRDRGERRLGPDRHCRHAPLPRHSPQRLHRRLSGRRRGPGGRTAARAALRDRTVDPRSGVPLQPGHRRRDGQGPGREGVLGCTGEPPGAQRPLPEC